MSQLSVVMAKLSGIRRAIVSLMNENISRNRSKGEILTRSNYAPDQVQHYFTQAADLVETLRGLRPNLYDDFQSIKTEPELAMAASEPGQPAPVHFSRGQADRLVRDIDQVFEIRANSELEQPSQEAARRGVHHPWTLQRLASVAVLH